MNKGDRSICCFNWKTSFKKTVSSALASKLNTASFLTGNSLVARPECSTRALIVSRREIKRVMKDGYLFLMTGNSRLARPCNYERSQTIILKWRIPVRFVVNKGDRSIRCFSQFRNELLSIRQGRAELGC